MRDIDIRRAVWSQLAIAHAGDPDTRLVQEMGVWSGTVRIDIAVINGELVGYELKSDSDTLQRLPGQAELYGRVFDRVVLVVGKKHALKAKMMVPTWWGVTVATSSGEKIVLTPKRQPKRNPQVDPYLLAKLLWKSEALGALAERGLAKGWKGRSVDDLHKRLATELTLSELSAAVRAALKARLVWLGQTGSYEGQMSACSDSNPCRPASSS